jgi:uncharacterized protein YegL
MKIRWFVGMLLGVALLACWQPQTAEAACATTRVYLVLDVSGSMKGTKHTIVRNAIQSLTTAHRSKLEFGMATFGSNFQHKVNVSSTGWQTIYNAVNSYPSNEGYTRMGTALKSAGSYLWGLKNSEPSATRNRPYYVILITDGYPTGENVDPVNETKALWNNYGIKTFVIGIQFNATLLNSIAKEGQTTKAYNANDQNALNSAFNAIANQASAEICDGLDNDCDGQVDENLTRSCSNSCGTGTDSCVAGKWTGCSSLNNAKPETCDGKDNDCDGQVDENWKAQLGQSCTVGSGSCRGTAKFACKPDGSGVYCPIQSGNPKPETCNGVDDDCDGLVDEGVTKNCSTACGSGTQRCLLGFWLSCSAPQPKTETCNNQDDDCDGQTDEDWTLKGKSCTLGAGSCAKFGTWKCNASGTSVECVPTGSNAKPEICDGLDNDCDGQVDENWPNKGKSCGSGTGACASGGVQVCNPSGTGLRCSATSGTPQPEQCDGLDNDCDGKADEGLTRNCTTNCGSGTETCKGGRWVGCSARTPTPETCDGVDNDCDGAVDNGVRRACKGPCGPGTEICIAGTWNFCDAPKPEKEVCDGKDNDCNGKTDDIDPRKCQSACGDGQSVCQNGQWTKCQGPPPEKEVCDGKDNDCNGAVDDGVTRTCKGVCGEGKETCTNGSWGRCDAPGPGLEICDGKDNDCDGTVDNGAKCPAGAICRFGRCFRKCRNGECPAGSTCEGDVCNGNLCEKMTCPTGRACAAGRCVDPCDLGTCPNGYTCNAGKCVDPTNPMPTEPGSNEPGNGTGSDAGNGNDTGGSNPPDVPTSSGEPPTGGSPDSTTTGTGGPEVPNVQGGPGTGCLCSAQSSAPAWPVLFLAVFLFLFATRRKTRQP